MCDADLDTLQSLLEKSLLGFAGERYWMLETIREYAAEQLDEGEAMLVQRRLRAWVLALAEASAPVSTRRARARCRRPRARVREHQGGGVACPRGGEPDEVGRVLGGSTRS